MFLCYCQKCFYGLYSSSMETLRNTDAKFKWRFVQLTLNTTRFLLSVFLLLKSVFSQNRNNQKTLLYPWHQSSYLGHVQSLNLTLTHYHTCSASHRIDHSVAKSSLKWHYCASITNKTLSPLPTRSLLIHLQS